MKMVIALEMSSATSSIGIGHCRNALAEKRKNPIETKKGYFLSLGSLMCNDFTKPILFKKMEKSPGIK